MAIQFPANPQVGDPPFTDPTSGESWVWDGTKWNLLGGGDVDVLWEQNGNDIFYNNGNVGVGTNAPGSPLAVSTATAGAAFDITSTQAGNNGGLRVSVGVEDREARLQATFGNSQMTFYTEGATGGPRERARIDNAGRLGVGVIDPGATLEVQSNNGGEALYLRNDTNDVSQIHFRNQAGTATEFRIGTEGGNAEINVIGTRSLGFRTTGIERMRIASGGQTWLVGNTNQLAHFFIQGAADGSNLLFRAGHSATGIDNGSGTQTFQIVDTGDVRNTTGNQISPIGSERRIKDKIGSFDPTEAWNVVKNATPRPYELKEMPGTQCYGYIVDELEKVDKKLILPGTTEDEKGPIRTYDSNKLAFMYRVALKEALERIEALEARLAKLEGGATKATTRRTTRK